MEIKDKIFKRKSGKSKGKWVLRIEYFDEVTGKEKCIERHSDKKGDATDKRNKLIDDLKKSHGQMQTGERMTFNQLADLCEKLFYGPAVIHEGRKVSGARSSDKVIGQIKNLRKFFGKRLIKEITTESLTSYKLQRLKDKVGETDRNIKITTVNRELAAMRRMMRHAYGKGWILKDIFFNAKVIDTSAETERTRILTLAEEARLLSFCEGEREVEYERTRKGKKETVKRLVNCEHPHLKAMIILAIDSGMRRGEILKLTWNDIDFENGYITALATNTKTERERLTPLSERAQIQLTKLKEVFGGEGPFPYKEMKSSFNTAKKLAGIKDLHFHDLRRTAITRWIQQGTPLALAGKLGGHSQLETTMKHYISNDEASVKEITERMDNFNQKNLKNIVESKMLN
jgi:integrase